MSDESKQKMSDSAKLVIHAQERNLKISQSVTGDKNYWYRREFTENHKKNISKGRLGIEPSNKGKTKFNYNKINELYINGNSIMEISIQLEYNINSVKKIIQKLKHTKLRRTI